MLAVISFKLQMGRCWFLVILILIVQNSNKILRTQHLERQSTPEWFF